MSTYRENLLDALHTVFSQRGYDGATLTHLAEASGLSKASLYHHFPGGKPEMAEILVRRSISELQAGAYSHIRDGGDMAAGLHRFVEGFGRYLESHQGNCLLLTFTLHTTAHDELSEVQHTVRRQFQDWHEELASFLKGSGMRSKRAEREAHLFLGQLYGALITAKVHNNPTLLRRSLNRIAKRITS